MMTNRLMRFSLCSWLALLALAPVAWADEPAAGKQVAQSAEFEIDSTTTEVHYWLSLPGDYDGDKEFPLMLFLHGAGERGDDLDLVTKWGPPKLVAGGQDLPFVLISPQCPRNERWNAQLMARLVDKIAGDFAVDNQRMYVTGLSMGGYGSWDLLATHPKLFAAAVPICGGGDPQTAEQFKHVPVWAFHGDQDRAVPLARSQAMVDAVNEAGGNAKLTVYEGVGHNSWTETYANAKVYEWLLSHRRQ